jgi:hypothetical protein
MTTVLGLGRARRNGLAEKIHTANLFSLQLGRGGRAISFLIPLGLLASACDRDSPVPLEGAKAVDPGDPRPPVAPESESRLVKYLGLDAGDLEVPMDPPAPAGDLKAEIEHFTSIDSCVEARAQLDPLLGDALEAIGYDTFLRDACRLVDAAKARDANRCAAIDASGLETRCRATVAEIAATPEACPWEASSRPLRGREPKCVAIASRSAGLCIAVVDPLDRATCKATVARSNRACATLPTRLEQTRCSRDAARWSALLTSDDSKPSQAETADEPTAVTGRLHIESADSADKSRAIDVDLEPDLARGVTLIEQHDGVRLVIGALSEAGLDFIAPSPHVRASLALELFVPAGAPSAHGESPSARIDRAELLVPGRPPLSIPGAQSTLVARLGKLTHRRGGLVAITVEGDLSGSGSRWHVHADASTFLRDIVEASELYGRPPRLGVDAGMR